MTQTIRETTVYDTNPGATVDDTNYQGRQSMTQTIRGRQSMTQTIRGTVDDDRRRQSMTQTIPGDSR